jgi:hypothetical protein
MSDNPKYCQEKKMGLTLICWIKMCSLFCCWWYFTWFSSDSRSSVQHQSTNWHLGITGLQENYGHSWGYLKIKWSNMSEWIMTNPVMRLLPVTDIWQVLILLEKTALTVDRSNFFTLFFRWQTQFPWSQSKSMTKATVSYPYCYPWSGLGFDQSIIAKNFYNHDQQTMK